MSVPPTDPDRREVAKAGDILVVLAEAEPGDAMSLVAMTGASAVLGRARITRLYGSRGAIALELATPSAPQHNEGLPSAPEVIEALLDATDRVSRQEGLARLELDAASVNPLVVQALMARARRHEEPVHLSWPTTTTW